MVSSLSVNAVEADKLHLDILPAATRRAFLECIKLPLFQKNEWYLAGGTALALQVGHRQSVDLDFFTTKANFNELLVIRKLLATGNWQTSYNESGTIYGKYREAKMSLIAYPFFVPSKEKLHCGTIRILLPHDIAAMKIIAVSQRGRKRDFIDLYWYVQNCESLINVVKRAVTQYPGQEKNIHHIIKSLVYFADAESDPEPRIMFKANWKQVKRFFRTQVKAMAAELFG